MDWNFKFGLNVLNQMIEMGLKELQCDQIDCMAYNINLDFVLKTIQKYPTLLKINIYSNTENLSFSSNNRKEIYDEINSKQIEIHHISMNTNVIHAKMYRFLKNGDLIFGAIGSPNFSSFSNQNFESLLYINSSNLLKKMWDDIDNTYFNHGIIEKTNIPGNILNDIESDTAIDEKYLDGLWAHQKSIVKWMAKRDNTIVNIPPGCGKTKIAMSYIKYLFEIDDDIAAVILVPTKTLIEQWLNLLEEENIQCYEWGTSLSGLDEFFANPAKKVIVTIYSRFYNQFKQFNSRLRILKPNLIIISDECHNLYEHLDDFANFCCDLEKKNIKIYNVGLSATIDSFKKDNVDQYINLMGGEKNIYEISLTSFYAHWNNLNPTPSLKTLNYIPVKYSLTSAEMKEYRKLSQHVGMQSNMKRIGGNAEFGAAIKRAMWVRKLKGGLNALKEYLDSHIEIFNEGSTIIFVQTNEMAEEIRNYLTFHVGWNQESSAYVYDSSRADRYREYALEQFKKNKGFCLISEIMLSEGFDIPKISRVILHGSRRSQRDWIQKIGRAIRYDEENAESVAEVIDIVFCYPDGNPLPIEEERFETIKSISI